MLDNSRGGLAWFFDSRRSKVLRIFAAAESYSSRDQLAFYAPDFALRESKPWFLGERADSTAASLPMPKLKTRVLPSQDDFFRTHAQILRQIDHGDLQKLVPVVGEVLEFEEALRFQNVLRPTTSGFYSYGFGFQNEGLSGLTPELLFEVTGDRLYTMALAGTAAADGPSLLDDPKERREHAIVVENLIEELQTFGEVLVGATEERPYGTLKHLYTPIEVRLQHRPEFAQLVKALHPTAALGGWPRDKAWRWLLQDPSADWRRRFGAPFGFVDGDHMVCVVAIRCLQWQGAKALLASGCGVVAQSLAAREWQELALKRAATIRNLGLEL